MRKSLTILFVALGTGFAQTEQSKPPSPSKQSPSSATKITNADIIQMVNAGLSEQVIVLSVRQAPVKGFDLTPLGLISLKKAHVPDAVILAMQGDDAPPKPPSSDAKAPGDDTTSGASEFLRQRVTGESGGLLSLSSFQKTNGYEEGLPGQNLYVLEWQAEITAAQQDVWKAGDAIVGYWQNFRVMLQPPGVYDGLLSAASGMGGSAQRFAMGTRIMLIGDCRLRKTEQGWRIEELTVKGSKVIAGDAAGRGLSDAARPVSAAALTANDEEHDRLYGKNVEGTSGSLADLAQKLEAGEEITIPLRLDSGVGIVNMVNATVKLTKTSFAFTASCCWADFIVTPDKILALTKQPQPNQVTRLQVKVAIKNKKGDKESKKDFYFYNAAATAVGGSQNGQGASIGCDGCDHSIDILYALLAKMRAGGN